MASLRKKYQPQLGSPDKDDGAPVLSPPSGSDAKLLDAVAADAAKPPELEAKSPADQAAESALRQRLKEMETADALQREQQQPPRHATEPQQQQPAMPAHVQEWLSRHPEYADPHNRIAQLEINLATEKCVRDGLTWNDDDFLPSIERHLGIGQAQASGKRETPPPAARHVEPQYSAPQRQPARPMSAAVSAPPSREPPSMATGRARSYRAPLNRDELEIAAASGMTPEQYQMQKERMLRMKQSGEIQNG